MKRRGSQHDELFGPFICDRADNIDYTESGTYTRKDNEVTETVSYMGELIDVCTSCGYDVDYCKCEDEDQ